MVTSHSFTLKLISYSFTAIFYIYIDCNNEGIINMNTGNQGNNIIHGSALFGDEQLEDGK